MLFAKVTVSKPGVPDGKPYPITYAVGDVMSGDLARVFIKENWAVECDESGVVKTDAAVAMGSAAAAASVEGQEKPPEGPAVVEQPKAQAAPQVAIPDDWKTMKWYALQALAKKIADADVANPEGARVIIEAEIIARAAKS